MHALDWTTLSKSHEDIKRTVTHWWIQTDGYPDAQHGCASCPLPYTLGQALPLKSYLNIHVGQEWQIISHYAPPKKWFSCLLPQLASKFSKPSIEAHDLYDSVTSLVTTAVACVSNIFPSGTMPLFKKLDSFDWSNHGEPTLQKCLLFFKSWCTRNCISVCPEMRCEICTHDKQVKVDSIICYLTAAV